MKLAPLALALAAALISFAAHAENDDGCPTDEEMIASMSLAELEAYELLLQAPEVSFEEACKDATELDEEEAAGSRRHYCVKKTATYTSSNPDTGQDETASVTMYDYVSLPHKGQAWTHNVRVEFTALQGNAMAGLVVAPELYCGSCTDKQQFAPQTIAGPGVYEFSVPLGMNVAEGKTGQDTQLVLTRFNSDQSLLQSSAPELRCDKLSKANTSGCRFWEYPAVFEVSLSDPNTDESAAHIQVAQSVLTGKPGYWREEAEFRGMALTRTRNQDVRIANRKASKALCEARFPESSGTGLNCDEYPFAATNQGASLVPETSMSVKYILGADNQKVGSNLSKFLCTFERVLDGENFWVKIVD